jgi:hypothetical protein
MYSGVLYVLPSMTISPAWIVCITGVALGVVGELSSMPKDVMGFARCDSVAKSTLSAGGPSIRLASMSFCACDVEEVKGFLTSLATLMMTSKVQACSAVGSK